MAKEKKKNSDRFILTIITEKSEELKEKMISCGYEFREMTPSAAIVSGVKFYHVITQLTTSEKIKLCNFCDYLNGFRELPK